MTFAMACLQNGIVVEKKNDCASFGIKSIAVFVVDLAEIKCVKFIFVEYIIQKFEYVANDSNVKL